MSVIKFTSSKSFIELLFAGEWIFVKEKMFSIKSEVTRGRKSRKEF